MKPPYSGSTKTRAGATAPSPGSTVPPRGLPRPPPAVPGELRKAVLSPPPPQPQVRPSSVSGFSSDLGVCRVWVSFCGVSPGGEGGCSEMQHSQAPVNVAERCLQPAVLGGEAMTGSPTGRHASPVRAPWGWVRRAAGNGRQARGRRHLLQRLRLARTMASAMGHLKRTGFLFLVPKRPRRGPKCLLCMFPVSHDETSRDVTDCLGTEGQTVTELPLW